MPIPEHRKDICESILIIIRDRIHSAYGIPAPDIIISDHDFNGNVLGMLPFTRDHDYFIEHVDDVRTEHEFDGWNRIEVILKKNGNFSCSVITMCKHTNDITLNYIDGNVYDEESVNTVINHISDDLERLGIDNFMLDN